MNRLFANALLLLVALIWGTTFVAQQLGMSDVGPLTYTGARFLMGAVFVLPLAWREFVALRARGVRLGSRDLCAWLGLGVVLFLGVQLQQVGIMTTTVSNAGFLTALYVPLVPILGWLLLGDVPHPVTWPAAMGSLAGTFMLAGGRLDAFNPGDYWVLASTTFWAVHVLWVGRLVTRQGAPVLLAFTQFLVCGVIATVYAGLAEPVQWGGVVAALPAIAYGGVLSVGVAYTLQVVTQRHTSASDAAILLSAEIVFAALAGALYLDERLGPLQWAGGALIFLCIVAVQVVPMVIRPRACVVAAD